MKMIEVIGALFILAFLLPKLADLINVGFLDTQKRQAADHMVLVNRASANYVRKHHADLLSKTSATSGPTVSVADLVDDGLLPNGFRNRNVWGQEYAIYIRKDATSNYLRAVVLTTGGRGQDKTSFVSTVVPGAAALMGGAGGFVPTGDIPGQTADTLQGTGGGWILSLGAIGVPSPGPGHLGALTSFDSTDLGQDFLYRVAVPGHPELNAMQTELDMTDHAIRRVSELQFVEREITDESCTSADEQGRVFLDKLQGLYLCRDNSLEIISDSGNSSLLKKTTVAKSGDHIEKPTCAAGTNTVPAIFTAPSIFEAGPEAPPLTAVQTWAVSLSDTEWQVFARVQTPDKSLSLDNTGWVYPEENYGRILVMTTCAKETTPVVP